VLSFQQGTQHPYYVSAMSPAIAALTGIGAVALFQAGRRSARWRWVLPALVAITGGWAFILLRRTPAWNAWLPGVILAATVITVAVLLAPRMRRVLLITAGVTGLIAVLAGPAASAATPLATTISGNNPLAGPTAGGGGGFPAGGGGLDRPGGGFDRAGGDFDRTGGGFDRAGGGFRDGGDREPGADDRGTGGFPGGGLTGGGFAGGGGISEQLISYLEAHRDGATWLVAVSGSSTAAEIILETGGVPVMAMGGFTGSDPAPTLAQLQQYVSRGQLHYVLTGGGRGGFGGGGGGGGTAQVEPWVEQNCTAVSPTAYGASATTGGGQQLYRCG
jgi:hypothetical protein